MRHSQEEKERSHERIVEVAARRIRESGTTAPGVAEVMREAGLTHGGFYKHFDSREQLIAEAADRAFAAGAENLAGATAGADDPLDALLTAYLSAEHRDDPGAGCAVAALCTDAARADRPVRAAFTAQLGRYVERIMALLPPSAPEEERRDRAVATVCTMVGSLVLSRSVDDPAFADELLGAAGRTLRPAGSEDRS